MSEVSELPATMVCPSELRLTSSPSESFSVAFVIVNTPLVYALVRSGELRAAQFGGRGVWRVREDDLLAYIEAAYEKTAQRIAAGQIPEETTTED